MSPNVGNFVHDLVEMAKAMETLPQVQAELDRANTQIEEYAKQVQRLEMIGIERKAEIDSLYSRIRSLEVERDDASFRVLEAEDKAHVALIAARSAASNLGELIAELDPPKPEPVKEPEPQELTASGWNPNIEPVTTVGSSASDHIASTAEPSMSSAQNASEPSVPNAVTPISEVSQGQSESSPTNEATATASPVTDASVTQESVTKSDASSAEPTHGPYFGKRYCDYPTYVPLIDWIDGGGTQEDYNWRPIHRF